MDEYRYTKTDIGIFPTSYSWQPLKGEKPKTITYEAVESHDDTSTQMMLF